MKIVAISNGNKGNAIRSIKNPYLSTNTDLSTSRLGDLAPHGHRDSSPTQTQYSNNKYKYSKIKITFQFPTLGRFFLVGFMIALISCYTEAG
jgi:hypothetical protein